ncbi:hypothetical protein MPL3356_310052 [Mesorhizobium plurifarium]|uniref:Phosphoribosyltransferase domain-containing protein n=1 Tax=Mesorhizobium plurifarium TaxID=69974 RepID=A0A090DTT3_MESPL|nr:hypothetical protein MPL3356_310052 [Mesorhizobium plurifarium]
MNQQTALLSLFPAALHDNIIEFSRHIAQIDADYLVFMARKALRFYDLMVEAGFYRSDKIILSDHSLDAAGDLFRGKRIAIIDDTLILGTTLSRIKNSIQKTGAAAVTTHVLFADKTFWSKDIIVPDYLGATLEHDAMLNFCNASVLALQSRSIPYLTDFPFFKRFRIAQGSLSAILNLFDWRCFCISNSRETLTDTAYYTLLPSDELRERVSRFLFGDGFSSVIEIMKVRAFVRHRGRYSWVRLVPIFTLAPVDAAQIGMTLSGLLDRLLADAPSKDSLLESFSSPVGAYRLVQYLLAMFIGRIYGYEAIEMTPGLARLSYDDQEAKRHFSPRFSREYVAIDRAIEKLAVDFGASGSDCLALTYVQAEIPKQDFDVSARDMEIYSGKDPAASASPARQDAGASNVLVELLNAFVRLHYEYELPARKEALKLKGDIHNASALDAPHRDRLHFGLPWSVLAQTLFPSGRRLTARRRDLLSLALDHVVDWGIAVPILANRANVIFRAYRHGEDAPFADQEIALVHDAVSGFLEGAGASDLGNIELEKLMVILIRIGASREFLEVITGLSGNDGVVRIGYYLHGAIPFFRGSNTYIADNRESWLSRYLVKRKVLFQKAGRITLGTRPDAAMLKPNSSSQARLLGLILGMLTHKGDDGRPFLASNGLIVLATCPGPKDVVGALVAEAKILAGWLSQTFKPAVRSSLNSQSYAPLIGHGRRGVGMVAINSARLKFNAAKTGRFDQLVLDTYTFLSKQANGAVVSEIWKSFWSGVSKWDNADQLKVFSPWIGQLGTYFLDVAIDIFTIRAAAVYAQNKPKRNRDADLFVLKSQIEDLEKVFAGEGAAESQRSKSLIRLLAACTGERPIDSPHVAVEFSMEQLARHSATLSSAADGAAEAVNCFGSVEPTTAFQVVLWYNIVDSRGSKSDLSGVALEGYKARVEMFKQSVAGELRTITRKAAEAGVILQASTGNLQSDDDEKHIFFARAHARGWALSTLERLSRVAQIHDVRFRAILIPANFTGDPPFRTEGTQEIFGRPFWEHFTRLKAGIRSIEDRLRGEGRSLPRSCVWLCDAENGGRWQKPDRPRLDLVHDGEVTTEVDDRQIVIACKGYWLGAG